MPRPSSARKKALEAAEAAKDRRASAAGRTQALQLAQMYATLELAHQIGRLADQVPVYGPPEER